MSERLIDYFVYTQEDLDLVEELEANSFWWGSKKREIREDLKEIVIKELEDYYKEPVRELRQDELKDFYLDDEDYYNCKNTVIELKYFNIEERAIDEERHGHLFVTAKKFVDDEDEPTFDYTSDCLGWFIIKSEDEKGKEV